MQAIAQQWAGSVQWQCASTLRPRHKRKTGLLVLFFEQPDEINDKEIVFETMRSMAPVVSMLTKQSLRSEQHILPPALV